MIRPPRRLVAHAECKLVGGRDQVDRSTCRQRPHAATPLQRLVNLNLLQC